MTPNPYALAVELARPVVRGYISRTDVDLTLALETPDTGAFRIAQHLLNERLSRLETRRDITRLRIRRRLKPLIAMRKPPNVLLAEAHDVNGGEGFPFAEPEVGDIVATEVYWALPQGGRRYG
jgi:hypothetical protein